MKNGHKPANPLNGDKWQKELGNGVSYEDYKGLTKREYFAAMAMQGMMANPNASTQRDGKPMTFEIIAEQSVLAADELLKQLDAN